MESSSDSVERGQAAREDISALQLSSCFLIYDKSQGRDAP